MKVRLTAERATIVGGSWLLALWAHAVLPGTVPFALALALALVALSGAASWMARRPAPVAALDVPTATGCRPESAALRDMRAELRGLEAELHALVDRERTGKVAASVALRSPCPDARGGSNLARGSTA